MGRKLIVMLVTLVCICAASATALAAPNATTRAARRS
jgi:hypothetical protein